MKQFTIYFEFFGRKMKHEIVAVDEEHAKQQLEKKIKYFKIESKSISQEYQDKIFNTIKDIFGGIFEKK
jgi:hypothetical protein